MGNRRAIMPAGGASPADEAKTGVDKTEDAKLSEGDTAATGDGTPSATPATSDAASDKIKDLGEGSDKLSSSKSGFGLAGSAWYLKDRDRVEAAVNITGTLHSAGDLKIEATNDRDIIAIAGGGAFARDDAGQPSQTSALAGAFAMNLINHRVIAFGGATPDGNGKGMQARAIVVNAIRRGALQSFSAGIGAALASKGSGFGGSVAINDGVTVVESVIRSDAIATQGDLTVTAENAMALTSVGGGIGLSKGARGFGGALGYNALTGDTRAQLLGQETTVGGDLTIRAQDRRSIQSFAFSAGIGLGGLGAAFTVSINDLSGAVYAGIGNSAAGAHSLTLTSGQMDVLASDETTLLALAGALSISKSGGAFGAGIAWNTMGLHTQAALTQTSVKDAGAVTLRAISAGNGISGDKIAALAIGASGSSKGAAVTVNLAYNRITNQVSATVSDQSAINASGMITIEAKDDADIGALVGAVALSLKSGGAGAALSINAISTKTLATVGAAQLVSAQDITIRAMETSEIRSLAVGAAGGKSFALGGSVTLNFMRLEVKATVPAPLASLRARNIHIIADNRADATVISGSAALSKGAAVGLSLTLLDVDMTTQASVAHGARVQADAPAAGAALHDMNGVSRAGVVIEALADLDVTTLAFAGAVSAGLSGAGAGSVPLLKSTVFAGITDGSALSARAQAGEYDITGHDVIIQARQGVDLLGVAGALGLGKTAAVGAAGTVGSLTLSTTAQVGAYASVKAGRTMQVDARAGIGSKIISVGLSTGGSAVAFNAGIVLFEATTDARIGAHARVLSLGNVVVQAVDDLDLLSVAGSLAAAGKAAAGIPVVVDTLDIATTAEIGDFAQVDAHATQAGTEVLTGAFTAPLAFDSGSYSTSGGVTTFTIAGHDLASGDQLVYRGEATTGDLTRDKTFVVKRLDANRFQLIALEQALLGGSTPAAFVIQSGVAHQFQKLRQERALPERSFAEAAISISDNTIAIAGHGYRSGDELVFTSEAGRLAALKDGQRVFVGVLDDNRVALYASRAAALDAGMAGRLSLADGDADRQGAYVLSPVAIAGTSVKGSSEVADQVVADQSRMAQRGQAKGLHVLALSTVDYKGIGAGIAASGKIAAALSGSAAVHDIDTKAVIGSGSKINQGNTTAQAQDVTVRAVRNYDALVIGASVAGSGAGAGAAGLGLTILSGDTIAEARSGLGAHQKTQLAAKGHLLIEAQTRESFISVAAGAGGAGGVALGGSAAVVQMDTTTKATVGDWVTLNAKDIALRASGHTDILNIAGALAGGGAAAIGGAVSVVLIDKAVTTQVGHHSDLPTHTGDITITSTTREEILSVGASAAGAGKGALGAGIVYLDVASKTNALVGASVLQSSGAVTVAADNQLDAAAYGGGLGVAGVAGAGAGVAIAVINNQAGALMNGTDVTAAGAGGVTVRANSHRDITLKGFAAGLGGLGLAGGVAVLNLGGALDGGYNGSVSARNEHGAATTRGSSGSSALTANGSSVSGSLDNGLSTLRSGMGSVSSPVAAGSGTEASIKARSAQKTGAVKRPVHATSSAGSSAKIIGDAQIKASKLTVSADETLKTSVGGLGAGIGGVGIGAGVSVAKLSSSVEAIVGDAVTLDEVQTNQGIAVSVGATFKAPELEIIGIAGSAGGIAASGAVSVLRDQSSVLASLGADAMGSNTAGQGLSLRNGGVVTVKASSDVTSQQAVGAAALGGVALAAAVLDADVASTVTAQVGRHAQIGAAGDEIDGLTVMAQRSFDLTPGKIAGVTAPMATALAAGAAAGGVNFARSTVAGTVTARLGESSTVHVDSIEDLHIIATSASTLPSASIVGGAVGLLSGGYNVLKLSVTENVSSEIARNAQITGYRATSDTPSSYLDMVLARSDISFAASATAGSAGLISASGVSVDVTVSATATARLADGVQVDAASGDMSLSAHSTIRGSLGSRVGAIALGGGVWGTAWLTVDNSAHVDLGRVTIQNAKDITLSAQEVTDLSLRSQGDTGGIIAASSAIGGVDVTTKALVTSGTASITGQRVVVQADRKDKLKATVDGHAVGAAALADTTLRLNYDGDSQIALAGDWQAGKSFDAQATTSQLSIEGDSKAYGAGALGDVAAKIRGSVDTTNQVFLQANTQIVADQQVTLTARHADGAVTVDMDATGRSDLARAAILGRVEMPVRMQDEVTALAPTATDRAIKTRSLNVLADSGSLSNAIRFNAHTSRVLNTGFSLFDDLVFGKETKDNRGALRIDRTVDFSAKVVLTSVTTPKVIIGADRSVTGLPEEFGNATVSGGQITLPDITATKARQPSMSLVAKTHGFDAAGGDSHATVKGQKNVSVTQGYEEITIENNSDLDLVLQDLIVPETRQLDALVTVSARTDSWSATPNAATPIPPINKLTVTSTKSVVLAGVIDLDGGAASITTQGSILGQGGHRLKAGSVALMATQGSIGSSAVALVLDTPEITQITALHGIWLRTPSAVVIKGLTAEQSIHITAEAALALDTATTKVLKIQTAGDLTLGAVQATTRADVTTGGDISAKDPQTQSAALSTDLLTLNSSGKIGQAASALKIDAATLNATASQGVFLTDLTGGLKIGVVQATGGDIVISTAENSQSPSQDLELSATSSVVATAGNVTLSAADNLLVLGSALQSALIAARNHTVTLRADVAGPNGKDSDGGALVRLAGRVIGKDINVQTGAQADRVEVARMAADAIYQIDTGAGDDVLRLSSTAGSNANERALGEVTEILGQIVFDGGDGADRVVIDQSGLSGGTPSGASSASNKITDQGVSIQGLQNNALRYEKNSVEAVEIYFGDGDDWVEVSGGSLTYDLHLGGGDDRVSVSGSDEGLKDIAKAVNLMGGAGSNRFDLMIGSTTQKLSGSFTGGALNGFGLAPTSVVNLNAFSSANITLSGMGHTLNLQELSTGLTGGLDVALGAGAHTVWLGESETGSSGDLTRLGADIALRGQGDDDVVHIKRTADVAKISTREANGAVAVEVDGKSNGEILLSGLGRLDFVFGDAADTLDLGYAPFAVTVDAGGNNDSLTLANVSGAARVQAGAGADTIVLKSGLSGGVTIDGQADGDKVILSRASTSQALTVGVTDAATAGVSFTGVLDSALSLSGIETLDLELGAGNDTVTVNTSAAKQGDLKIRVDAGAGDDVFHVINAAGDGTTRDRGAALARVTLLGGAGQDSLNVTLNALPNDQTATNFAYLNKSVEKLSVDASAVPGAVQWIYDGVALSGGATASAADQKRIIAAEGTGFFDLTGGSGDNSLQISPAASGDSTTVLNGSRIVFNADPAVVTQPDPAQDYDTPVYVGQSVRFDTLDTTQRSHSEQGLTFAARQMTELQAADDGRSFTASDKPVQSFTITSRSGERFSLRNLNLLGKPDGDKIEVNVAFQFVDGTTETFAGIKRSSNSTLAEFYDDFSGSNRMNGIKQIVVTGVGDTLYGLGALDLRTKGDEAIARESQSGYGAYLNSNFQVVAETALALATPGAGAPFELSVPSEQGGKIAVTAEAGKAIALKYLTVRGGAGEQFTITGTALSGKTVTFNGVLSSTGINEFAGFGAEFRGLFDVQITSADGVSIDNIVTETFAVDRPEKVLQQYTSISGRLVNSFARSTGDTPAYLTNYRVGGDGVTLTISKNTLKVFYDTIERQYTNGSWARVQAFEGQLSADKSVVVIKIPGNLTILKGTTIKVQDDVGFSLQVVGNVTVEDGVKIIADAVGQTSGGGGGDGGATAVGGAGGQGGQGGGGGAGGGFTHTIGGKQVRIGGIGATGTEVQADSSLEASFNRFIFTRDQYEHAVANGSDGVFGYAPPQRDAYHGGNAISGGSGGYGRAGHETAGTLGNRSQSGQAAAVNSSASAKSDGGAFDASHTDGQFGYSKVPDTNTGGANGQARDIGGRYNDASRPEGIRDTANNIQSDDELGKDGGKGLDGIDSADAATLATNGAAHVAGINSGTGLAISAGSGGASGVSGTGGSGGVGGGGGGGGASG
ncbi:MAG: hypothetical protein N4A70_03095, partial [Pelagimonas sp.]|nr:hypothetical protein [Pelagimonas sp.]